MSKGKHLKCDLCFIKPLNHMPKNNEEKCNAIFAADGLMNYDDIINAIRSIRQ